MEGHVVLDINANTDTNTPDTATRGVIPVAGIRGSRRPIPGGGARRQLLPNGVYQTVSPPNALPERGIRTAGGVIA